MRPRIKLDPTRPGWGKWQCTSTRVPAYGGVHVVAGKGYSPKEAYRKWRRALPREDRRTLADRLCPPGYWDGVERLIHKRCARLGLLVGDWPRRIVERKRERFEMRLMTAVMPEAR